jgi:hypothetical protein
MKILVYSYTRMERKTCYSLIQNIEFILMVWNLNQGNPSAISEMDLRIRTGADLQFFLHAVCHAGNIAW